MDFDSNKPIYIQIMDSIKEQMIKGELKADEKVMAVRELAFELKTNPNTIQHALQELEREGFLYSKRGLGRYVTSDVVRIKQLERETVESTITDFLNQMKAFGYNVEEVLKQIEKRSDMNDRNQGLEL